MIAGIVRHCGIALQKVDSSLVSFSDQAELDRVKKGFLTKKLQVPEDQMDAALRLGFRFEGVFRQALIYKGRNRDTAWFAMTDTDWPQIRAAHERWLDPTNFTAAGRALTPLRVPSS